MKKKRLSLLGTSAVQASGLTVCFECKGEGCRLCDGAGLLSREQILKRQKQQAEQAKFQQKYGKLEGRGW